MSLARLIIGRAGETGQLLSCVSSTISGTELGRDEFRDAIRLRYGRTPVKVPVENQAKQTRQCFGSYRHSGMMRPFG